MLSKTLLGLLLSVFASAACAISTTTTVPFTLYITQGDVVTATYNLDNPPNKTISCYCYRGANVVMEYPLNGQIQRTTLPAMLTFSPNYSGAEADTTGQITLTTDSPAQVFLVCEYRDVILSPTQDPANFYH